jgi:hypothetical protein
MDYLDDLYICEQRLRELVRRSQTPDEPADERSDTVGYPSSPANLEIASVLSEAQMLLERHLAETVPAQRSVERYRLEYVLPTFTYLKRWYHLFHAEEWTEQGSG